MFTFLVLLLFLGVVIPAVCTHEYDATGKKITFFPNAMMFATNPKVLVFFNNTRLVNIHTDLHAFPRGKTPNMNTTCDPVQADFYQKVLASLRGIQRTTHRLLSIQGVTNFLECDSFLRRYYQYGTICFPPQAVDSTTLAIMVQLLEGRTIEPKHFPFLEVCAVAQYLLIDENYLTPYLLDYMTDEETWQSPFTFKGIESLYVARYHNLAKHLYILACSRSPPQTLRTAYEIFPDLFQETDFFWG